MSDLRVNVLETDPRGRLGRGRRIGRYPRGEDVQGCRSIVVRSIHISAMCQQLFDDAELEVPDRAMERRVTRGIPKINERGILLENFSNPPKVPHASGVMDAE
jgi:hypothetical protein